jgi:uncharacterized repeat protein (TIGR01451 family)
MNKIYTFLLVGAFLLSALTISPSRAFADCQSIYGGGQTCSSNEFTIVKLVQVPGKGGGNYVNNLFQNDSKYFASQQVNFEIIVQNTGSQTIQTLNIVDTFPQYISFVSGLGNFDTNNKTLSFTVSNLNPGQSNTYVVSAKIFDANNLPANQGIMCLENLANATDNTGITHGASSTFCVEQNVLGATPTVITTPATGPEMLPLLALLPGGLGGLILRKKSIKTIALEEVKI